MIRLIAPFAVWMTLLMALPPTPACYAVRTGVTALVLAACLAAGRFRDFDFRRTLPTVGWGVAVGLAVFAIWVLPEGCDAYRRYFIWGEGGTASIGESSTLLLAIRLVGSAFVISIAEELFFRKWLVDFAGFWWMVALFAVEHDRWLVGAIAGIAYGLLARRRGLGAAIVAHAVTNLVLGLYVIRTAQWGLW